MSATLGCVVGLVASAWRNQVLAFVGWAAALAGWGWWALLVQ